MTQAIQYEQLGGPEVLTLHEVDLPETGPGEIRIRVEAAGVNPVDGKLRSGLRPSPPFTGPRGTGHDGAGIVTEVGADVDGFRVGDAVAFGNAHGAYATDVVVAAIDAAPRPAAVSAAAGAALGIPAGTAYQTIRSLAVSANDTVLVHGGSGSVGQFLIQYARLLGATVIATSSQRRAELVHALGATQVEYGPGLIERVRAIAPDGVSVAIDAAGTDEANEASIALVHDRSRAATLVRGADAAGWGIRSFRGGGPAPLTAQEEAWRREALPLTLSLLAAGAFQVELGESFPLAEAGRAQAAVDEGADGKVVVIP